jgi:hypothetical protein
LRENTKKHSWVWKKSEKKRFREISNLFSNLTTDQILFSPQVSKQNYENFAIKKRKQQRLVTA